MNRQFRSATRRGKTIRALALGLVVAVANLTPSAGRAQSTEGPRAATLGQPRPAATLGSGVRPVVRASQNDLSDESTETSVAERPDLDPWKKDAPASKPTAYPPTYSSTKKELVPKVIGDLWKQSNKETSVAPTAITPITVTPPATTAARPTYRDPRRPAAEAVGPEKIKETLPMPKSPPEVRPYVPKPVVLPATNFGVPAWRWYGYGTITPGVSTPTGDGTYPLAPVGWLQENRATPGAIPQGYLQQKASAGLRDAPPNYSREVRVELPPQQTEEPVTVLVPREEMPRIEPPPTEPNPKRGVSLAPITAEREPVVEPKRVEMPREPEFVLPPPLPPTGLPLTQRDARGGTTIYFPLPPSSTSPKANFDGSIKPRTLPPTSMRTGPRPAADPRFLARGQAPAAQPESILNSTSLAPKLERAAQGAREVHMHLTRTNRVGIRLVVPHGVDFEAIADRIGAIPELARFYLDFDVIVR